MILNGRPISKGRAEGTAVVIDEAFSFLGGADPATGTIKPSGKNIAGKVFVFPRGKGSTVGSFVMYDLLVHGKAPVAVVNSSAETIVTTGAVISSIPMTDHVDTTLLKDGDRVIVDGDAGTVELPDVKMIDSVSSVVVIDGKIMMLKRPDTSRSFPGVWSLCAGKVESGESPKDASAREILEETGISVGEPISSLDPVMVRENDVVWRVWPFLHRADGAVPVLNHENTAYRMFDAQELEGERLVPKTLEVVGRLLSP